MVKYTGFEKKSCFLGAVIDFVIGKHVLLCLLLKSELEEQSSYCYVKILFKDIDLSIGLCSVSPLPAFRLRFTNIISFTQAKQAQKIFCIYLICLLLPGMQAYEK